MVSVGMTLYRVGKLAASMRRFPQFRRRSVTSLGLRDSFQQQYQAMLDEVIRLELPTAICTIYDARFPEP